MESRLLLFLALLLCLVVVGSHASGAGEKYWHAVLPKTPFPKALQDLFQPNSESRTVVDKNNDGMVTDERQKLEILEDTDGPPSSSGFSRIMKDASISYGKQMHSKLDNLQYDDSVPSKDLSESTKDITIIYGKPRNLQKMNLLHDYPPSAKGFSKIMKDASVSYGKPMHSEQANFQYGDSVPSRDLSESTKDITIIYGKPRNSQKMNLLHGDPPPSEDFSKIMKDASIAYEKTRNSEQILPDDVRSSKDLLKLLKNLSNTYAYGKSNSSPQKNLQSDDDSALSQDMLEILTDLSTVYEKSKKSRQMKLEFDDSAPTKDFSNMNQDIDLPQAKQPAKDPIGERTIFYVYNDLHPGKRMTLLFTNAGNKVDFLPRQVAEKIPFSTDKVPEILHRFSIDPESADAEVVKDTIGDCENRHREEWHKHCATSLESLVDQNVARLGRNIRVLSTPEGKKQEYTVLSGTKKIADDRVIVCHKERYPYAVYYCHEINDTEVYTVPLMGADGTKLKAVTVCHKETSAWSPDYIGFQTLKTEPGQPFCHFLSSDALVWFQTKELGHDLMAYLQNILNQGAFDI